MFERRYPITFKVNNVIVTLEELLLADTARNELPDDYYNELKKVIEDLRIISNMTKETEN